MAKWAPPPEPLAPAPPPPPGFGIGYPPLNPAPPHVALYQGISHVSAQLEEVLQALAEIRTRVDGQVDRK